MSAELTLNVYILDSTKCFPIRIAPSSLVGDLKKKIAKARPKLLPDPGPDKFRLWRAEALTDEGDLTSEARKFIEAHEKSGGESLRASRKVSEYFNDDYWESVPSTGSIHVVVEVLNDASGLEPPRKRMRFTPDMSTSAALICQDLVKPFDSIPVHAHQLPALMKARPLVKLPIPCERFHQLSQTESTITEVFQPGENSLSYVIWAALAGDDLGPKVVPGTSENMLVAIVDSLVRFPLRAIAGHVGVNITMDRNKTDAGTTTIAQCRPDFLLWLDGTLIFLGEERAEAGGKSVTSAAKSDLAEKFNSIDPEVFGDIKYKICYAVDGPIIRFYAAEATTNPLDRFTPLTGQLDINKFFHRVKILIAIINILRLIITIKDALPQSPYPLGKRMRTERLEIIYNFDNVEKRVVASQLPFTQNGTEDRVNFLRQMYEHAKSCRGLAQVLRTPQISRNTYSVKLSTKGVHRVPYDEKELQNMMRDVIQGLARLHEGRYLHHDVRRPNCNIVYDPRNKQYVLVDFEHGSKITRSAWSLDLLKNWDEGTLDNGVYTTKSEMYQVGKLLDEFRSIVSSKEGEDFVEELKAKKMTAKMALEHKWLA